MRLRRGGVAGAQPLRHPHLGLRHPAGLPGRLQQSPRLLLQTARRLPAAVLWLPTFAGQGLVEIPTALPRDNVQGGDVFRLIFIIAHVKYSLRDNFEYITINCDYELIAIVLSKIVI